MPVSPASCLYLVALAFVVSACGSVPVDTDALAKVITPYKIDIVQGNVVTREQAALLRPGMPRAIVQDVLGTPLLTSVFHADRWDYVFTFQRRGIEPQNRKLTVYFTNDVIERIESDDLPSETEFVSTLRSNVPKGPAPALSASEEELQKIAPSKKSAEPTKQKPAPAAAGTVSP